MRKWLLAIPILLLTVVLSINNTYALEPETSTSEYEYIYGDYRNNNFYINLYGDYMTFDVFIFNYSSGLSYYRVLPSSLYLDGVYWEYGNDIQYLDIYDNVAFIDIFYNPDLVIEIHLYNGYIYTWEEVDLYAGFLLDIDKDSNRNISYESGYDDGYYYGYDDGYYYGYDDGVYDGLIEADSYGFKAMLASIFGGLGSFLSLQLLPGISFGAIIAVPIVFGLIAWILGRRKD